MSAPKFATDRSHYGPALEAWFRRRFPEWTDVAIDDIDIPVATGFSNETVFCTVARTVAGVRDRQRFVVRIEPTGGALFPAQTPACAISVDVQHRAMAVAAAHADAPIPEVIGYEADTEVLGVPFFVMAHVDGRVPSDNPRYTREGWLVDATPDQRRHLVEQGLRAMAAVHAFDWHDADLGWLDRSATGSPTLGDQLDLYRSATLEWLDGRDHPTLDAAFDWLRRHDPHDERIGLTWGDARLGNIIWDGFDPVAVVDWEATAISPLEADIGWWLMFDRMSFDDMGIDRLDGYPSRAEQIAIYEAASGREVCDAHYWEVFGAMRFCAIFIGLGDRLVDVGLMAPEQSMAVDNLVTDALARLLTADPGRG
ncbi:MAG: phosphotransferase family protein [Actinomycetota bacterium]